MSFIQNIMAYQRKKREGTSSPPMSMKRSRGHDATSVKPQFTLRSDPPKRGFVPGIGEIEEEIGADEIYVPRNETFAVFDDPVQHVEEFAPMPALATKAISLFEIGEKMLTTPDEQLPGFYKMLTDSTRGRLEVNKLELKELYDDGDPLLKTIAVSLAGAVALMETVVNRKTVPPPNTLDLEKLMCSLSPLEFLSLPPSTIEKFTGSETTSANAVLATLPPSRGTLRSVVYTVAAHWIRKMIPLSSFPSLSTSQKPKSPQITLPSRFLNTPISLLAQLIYVDGLAPNQTKEIIGHLFVRHITYQFEHARKLLKKDQIPHENQAAVQSTDQAAVQSTVPAAVQSTVPSAQ